MQFKIQFGQPKSQISLDEDGLSLHLSNPVLGNNSHETWKIAQGTSTTEEHFHILKNDKIQFGVALLEVTPETLEQSTYKLFQELFALLDNQSLYRMWHFVPQINALPENSIEHYQLFCRGRSQAFEEAFDAQFESMMPSATAVGTQDSKLAIIYYAGTHPATYLENPEQVPAYKYPTQYGPRAPSFSRASKIELPEQTLYAIAGTASIKGAETIHQNNFPGQIQVTLDNLDIIGQTAGLGPALGRSSNHNRTFKVYLRHPNDYAEAQARLEEHLFNPKDSVVYLQADICREALDIEIECAIFA